jgi:hypothetical protein
VPAAETETKTEVEAEPATATFGAAAPPFPRTPEHTHEEKTGR